ncbi:MAG: response regulator [Pseudobutyrivibrio sp.]|nr:response regulator [Pseudobutyrivibrio sp.]
MMEEIFTFEYLLDIICLAGAFFTFIKLISKDVNLNNHRILPVIAGIITIYNFYIFLMPLQKSNDTSLFLETLCDLCALVLIFMMFFYFLLIKRPKYHIAIVVFSLAVMISLCGYDFMLFSLDKANSGRPDLIAVLFVTAASILTELISPSRKYFDRAERIVGRYMTLAFIVAVVGYIAYDFYPGFNRIRSFAFFVDCAIFYWLASTNRIEDTETILQTTLFDRMENPIALVNAEFYVIAANDISRKIFVGENIEFAFEEGSSKNKFILGESLVRNEQNDGEFYAADKWFRIHYTPVEENNRIKGYIFTATDITDQHMEATNAKIETAQKSQFLAHMSHELRSPLHAMLGISEILITKKDISEKNRTLITHIKRAAENLLELVNAILDYSKLEADKFEFAERVYDVNNVFEDLAYTTILNIQSKPIDFNFAIINSYPRYLYGDAVRVREIFQNILSNAVKFTEKGTIHAEISFTKEGERQRINFSIEDTGRGMTPKQIEEAFNEYVTSADGVRTEGTGLGLAIVKMLIAKLDGAIAAESNGISGSILRGYFYQKYTPGEYLEERVLNRRTLLNQGSGLHGLPDRIDCIYPRASILVADDMRINLEIMKQLLAPWECEVVTVPDGTSAVRALQERHFDLVMLDQMMVPISGPEACKQIREFSMVPIILVTANTEDNVRDIIKDYGFSDFLAKPILGIELKKIIETYLPNDMAEPNTSETVVSVVKRNKRNSNVYQKTLEAFVKEMQPLLLNLPNYRKNDKEMFKVKVHGIAGVSKQIGRDTFAEMARIMEMAAKSDTWSYVDENIEEFLNSLCDVVEDATKELSQLAPADDLAAEEEIEKTFTMDSVIEDLYNAFDEYDLKAIEIGLDEFSKVDKNQFQEDLYEKLKDAYDNLEYEDGLAALEEYRNTFK